MKGYFKLFALLIVFAVASGNSQGQGRYTDFSGMSAKISKLAADYPSICSVQKIGKSSEGRDIFAISVGKGEKEKKPAIAIVGGVEGSYLLGCELALGFAETILGDRNNQGILDRITFYILPDVNPDATEQYFAKLKYERTVNGSVTDSDRDFKTDEDPFEDLNGDGMITQLRVTDPAGNMTESEDDARILVPSDLSKGQKGKYLVYTEGVDNDKDGLFNEDGPGGVNFNRNFTFNYEEFGQDAGLHAVSEAETRAVADYLYDRFNVFAVISFGPQDNLGQAPRAQERPAPGGGQQVSAAQQSGPRATGDRRITTIMKSDETILRIASDKYHEITGLKGAPPVRTTPGSFSDWVYFHYGRYSLSTPGWWIQADKAKSTEAAFLKYAEENKLSEFFVPWTEISHPEFKGKKAEVGGIRPFIMNNPPPDKLTDLIASNSRFILAMAAMAPELEFIDLKNENIGEDIYRITLKVRNKGVFATCAEVGDINQWTRIMRISLELATSQKLLSGQKVQRIQRLEGDKAVEYSWLVSGKGSVKITAGAVNTGILTSSVDLK